MKRLSKLGADSGYVGKLVGKLGTDHGFGVCRLFGGGVSRLRRASLFLASPRKSKQKEGDPCIRALRVPVKKAISEEPLELAIC